MPFEPKDGIAQWQALYALLRAAAVDDVVTYVDLADAIDADKASVQSAIRRAAHELETIDKRAITAVKNVGYRIVKPEEHLDIAKTHQRKSTRALERGHSTTTNVDMNGMEPDVRKAFETVAMAFSLQMEFNRRTDVRQSKLEDQLAAIHPKVERTEAEVAELRERLAKLEGTTPEVTE